MLHHIFDTHAHYDMSNFDGDRDILLSNLKDLGIEYVINMGVDIDSSKMSIKLAEKYDYIYATVGIHPENINSTLDIDSQITELSKLINYDKVVGIGEIGLDYHYSKDNIDLQKKLFECQIKLAKQFDLPIAIHDREAHTDTIDLLLKYSPKGIVHCFSGDIDMAKTVISFGMYIGVGGLITFKNATSLLDVVKEIPIEKIVLETDAPYMSPVPMRGKRCDSSFIRYTAEKISNIKDLPLQDVLNITSNNAKNIFKVGK